jgi:hypothetical protein
VPTGVHIQRHTFCSHLAMQGASMRGVQELVGHQSLAMTQRYSHLTPASLDATIRLLDNRPTRRAVGDSLETPGAGTLSCEGRTGVRLRGYRRYGGQPSMTLAVRDLPTEAASVASDWRRLAGC